MASILLDKKTIDALNAQASNSGKSTVLATSVARLYVLVEGQWKYTRIYGLVAYLTDRESKIQYIRIYDLPKLVMKFQVEVPVEPIYVMETEYFHTLELENSTTVGFLFASARENIIADDKNKTFTSEAKRFGGKVSQLSLKESDLREIKETKQASGVVVEAGGPKRRASTFMKAVSTAAQAVKSLTKGKDGTTTNVVQSVGTPTDFKHVTHVGLNPDGTFDMATLPADWIPYLKEAGISKKDLKNPEINKAVAQVLGHLVPNTSGAAYDARSKPATQNREMSVDNDGTDSRDDSGSKGSPMKPSRRMRVKFSFRGNSEKEVSVTDGDLVLLVKHYKDGWSKVKRSDGVVGCVPTNYLDDAGPDRGGAGGSNSNVNAQAAIPADNSDVVIAKKTPPAVPAPPRVGSSAAAPPRPQPPRPASSAPPPARPAPSKAPAPPAKEHVADEPEEETAADEQESPVSSSMPPPRQNPLLAGIQGFKKEDLAKVEETSTESRPPHNPLLASIQGFKKDGLARVDSPSPASKPNTPNPLEAIKSGNFQLKKVEKVEKPADAKPVATAEIEGIAGMLKAKLANIRVNIQSDDEDDDAGSDWD